MSEIGNSAIAELEAGGDQSVALDYTIKFAIEDIEHHRKAIERAVRKLEVDLRKHLENGIELTPNQRDSIQQLLSANP